MSALQGMLGINQVSFNEIIKTFITIEFITGQPGEHAERQQQHAEYKWLCTKHASGIHQREDLKTIIMPIILNNEQWKILFDFPQNMVNAVRRLPQIPQVGTVSTQESSSTTGGIFSKLFRRSANNPGLTEQQIQQQQLQLQQQRLLAQQQQQLLQQGGLQSSLSQPQGLASLAGGLAGQQQQQLLAQQQLLQQGGLQVSSSSHFVPVTCCKGSQLLVLKEGTSHSHNN